MNKCYALFVVLVIAGIVTACGTPAPTATQISPTIAPTVATAKATKVIKARGSAKDLIAVNQAFAALVTSVNGYVTSGDMTSKAANGVLAKINTIQAKVTKGDTAPAANELQAFINELVAQRDKKIPQAVANDLIAEAQTIIATIYQLATPVPTPAAASTPKPTP